MVEHICPYVKLGEDWDQIRFQASQELLHDIPEWAKQLKITDSLEVDMACDQAQTINQLIKRQKDLETENMALKRQVAEREKDEPTQEELTSKRT